ncbi:HEAT repeat domain-containing protein [Zavarzinella formosa]|uniref:HEAT repeat domain-containing protein n=1 Tax=Zavarzinella formosa TaxID=360055 RepID=UPI0002D9D07E|nr:HEAT repeat domain-containing protein [Zavarzinella formosa]
MASKDISLLTSSLINAAHTGVDRGAMKNVRGRADDAPSHLSEIGARLKDADDDEAPAPILELMSGLFQDRLNNAEAGVRGNVEEIPEGGHWSTPMAAESLYLLVPETRPFAKKVKPEVQVEAIETATRLGTVTDLRLLQIYLKHLEEKKDLAPVADAVAKEAIPAYGPQILPELWPTLGPDNRTFSASSKIDIQATLKRLTEKSPDKKAKGQDKQSQVTKAVEKILEDAAEGGRVGAESLPILKLALKYAPEPAFRRKVAETLAGMGEAAKEALPDLVDAFERTGFTRDYNLIRPMVVLGKESEEVGDSLIRALEDRDSVVRLMAAFNLGQMKKPAMKGLDMLENLSERDPEAKVRDQAAKTLNKLRLRLEPVGLPIDVEVSESANAG